MTERFAGGNGPQGALDWPGALARAQLVDHRAIARLRRSAPLQTTPRASPRPSGPTCAQAQAEDVGVVPLARAGSRLRVGAERGADARHLVGGDADARCRSSSTGCRNRRRRRLPLRRRRVRPPSTLQRRRRSAAPAHRTARRRDRARAASARSFRAARLACRSRGLSASPAHHTASGGNFPAKDGCADSDNSRPYRDRSGPRLAATVILARPANRAISNVYMTRRSAPQRVRRGCVRFSRRRTVDRQDFSPEAKARTLGLDANDWCANFARPSRPNFLAANRPSIATRPQRFSWPRCANCSRRPAFSSLARATVRRSIAVERALRRDVQAARTPVGAGELPFADFLDAARLVRRRSRANVVLALDHAAERASPL